MRTRLTDYESHPRHDTSISWDQAMKKYGHAEHNTQRERVEAQESLIQALNAVGNEPTPEEAAKTEARKANVAAAKARAEQRHKRHVREALVLTGALLATVILNRVAEKEPKTQSTATYTAKAGERTWDIARKIQLNTGDTSDMRPLVAQLDEQAKQDGNPGLQAHEAIQVPLAADIDSQTPGAQLSHE